MVSADLPPAPPRRRPGQHGASPLSTATRRRLLADLLRRAEAGDAAAAAALVRLSIEAGRAPKSGVGEG
jgi:hypothetical protein